jgi:SAM-dependent methyltransferase
MMLNRLNVAEKSAEHWRPPLFAPPSGALSRVAAALRRFFDLQAGSIWRDLEQLLPTVAGSVLDVGCGAQPYRQLFAKMAHYVGIDTEDAVAHFGYDIPDTRYFKGDRWPVEDSSIDFILCTETLEHIAEPTSVLTEAMRCLRPGGTLLLTVPFAARWHFIPYDYWRFTPSGLKRLLSSCGFDDVRVYARGNAVTVAAYKTMALMLRLIMPQTTRAMYRILLVFLSIPLWPLFVALAIAGNLSLMGDGGDDCLGYTVLTRKQPV